MQAIQPDCAFRGIRSVPWRLMVLRTRAAARALMLPFAVGPLEIAATATAEPVPVARSLFTLSLARLAVPVLCLAGLTVPPLAMPSLAVFALTLDARAIMSGAGRARRL